MPRQARLDIPGIFQHVMARGIENANIFSDDSNYRFFIKRLGELLEETQTDCFAWALIPNHFHLLLRTGPTSLATFMRRLMTSYAVYYNRYHQRSGHLFQNRYKSIVCEGDPYFLELVRYIHLNPLRSGLVKDINELVSYPWCGFGVLMGRYQNSWQETDEVLKYFANRAEKARMGYKKFMEDGIKQGTRPDLTCRGLPHSQKGLRSRLNIQEQNLKDFHDPRILGNGNFVRKVLQNLRDSEEKECLKLTLKDLAERVSNWSNITITDLTSGSKRTEIAKARAVLSYLAVRLCRMKTTDVADYLNVSQSAISKCLLSGQRAINENHGMVDEVLK